MTDQAKIDDVLTQIAKEFGFENVDVARLTYNTINWVIINLGIDPESVDAQSIHTLRGGVEEGWAMDNGPCTLEKTVEVKAESLKQYLVQAGIDSSNSSFKPYLNTDGAVTTVGLVMVEKELDLEKLSQARDELTRKQTFDTIKGIFSKVGIEESHYKIRLNGEGATVTFNSPLGKFETGILKAISSIHRDLLPPVPSNAQSNTAILRFADDIDLGRKLDASLNYKIEGVVARSGTLWQYIRDYIMPENIEMLSYLVNYKLGRPIALDTSFLSYPKAPSMSFLGTEEDRNKLSTLLTEAGMPENLVSWEEGMKNDELGEVTVSLMDGSGGNGSNAIAVNIRPLEAARFRAILLKALEKAGIAEEYAKQSNTKGVGG